VDEIREDADEEIPTLAYLVANWTDHVFCVGLSVDYDFPFFLQYPDTADLCIHAMDGTEIMDIEILMFVRS
jgi:hypothetical protein